MFLSILQHSDKANFLELAFYMANYNDEFAEEQKALLDVYRKEMNLSEQDYALQGKDVSEVFSYFRERDIAVRRAVFLETLGLIYSDGNYDDKEKQIVNIVREEIGLGELFCKDAEQWVIDTQELYQRAERLING